MERPRIAVVGGGIAGLAAAHRLQQILPNAQITLIEAQRRLGGIIRTARHDGFVIEEGPDSFISTKPAALALCRELGLESHLQGTIPDRRACIWWEGRLLPLPEGLSGLVPTQLEALVRSDLLSPAGRERVAEETTAPISPPGGDETLASFMRRRFGSEAYDRLIEPLMSGIYAGDGDQLSLAATFPHLRALELENGSVIRGLESLASAQAERRQPPFLTPGDGMQEIVDTLVARLDRVRIVPATRATKIARRAGGYEITLDRNGTITADSAVLALPAHQTAELVESFHRDLAVALGTIPYASTATVALAFPAASVPHSLDGTGYLVPRVLRRPVLACTWVTSKFAFRAPADSVLLRAFLGRYGHDGVLRGSDVDLVAEVRSEYRDILGITAEPTHILVSRWPRAMPQYTLGHLDRIAEARRCLHDLPGLYLAGSAYRGVGVPDCIASGQEAAAAIVHLFAPGPRAEQQ